MNNSLFERVVYISPLRHKMKNKETFFSSLSGRSKNILYYLKLGFFRVFLLSGTKRINPAVIPFLRKKKSMHPERSRGTRRSGGCI